MANRETVFPVQTKYHFSYNFRPTHHVISKSKRKAIAAVCRGEEGESTSLDIRAE